ncbi:MAG: adenine methyltransferase [candidate division Zixibacteria bacterium]|nr:adenine methyltransferase [candidate division Zixibacteria bacterium]
MVQTGFTHDNVNNKTVEWYTPKWVFDSLGLIFDLDPCYPELYAPSWIPVRKTYNKTDDGLSKEWVGNVWLNPPYGPHTKTWLKKLYNHGQGIALVFARTDCRWFQDICIHADGILFLRGRIKFVDGYGKTGGSGAGSGSMLVAWGRDNAQRLYALKDLGFFVNTRGQI